MRLNLHGNKDTMLGRNDEAGIAIRITFDSSAAVEVFNESGLIIGTGTWQWNDNTTAKSPDIVGELNINALTYRISAWYQTKNEDSWYSMNLQIKAPPRGELPQRT